MVGMLDTDDRDYYVPEHLRDGLKRYIDDGVPPGGFVRAFLANDLAGAVERADYGARGSLLTMVNWLRKHAPPGCHGSYAAVEGWIEAHRKRRLLQRLG